MSINSNEDALDLYGYLEDILEEDLGIKKYVFFRQLESEWVTSMEKGLGEHEKNFEVEKVLSSYEQFTVLATSPNPYLKEFDYIVPVYHKKHALAYLLLSDPGEEADISPVVKNLNLIQTLANIIVVAVENKRLFKEQLKQERVVQEMELASQIQKNLLPKSLPSEGSIRADGYFKSHHRVGGDYYDYVRIENGVQYFIIGDISGKGISAAFLMSNFQAYFRTAVGLGLDLESLFLHLNSRVVDSSNGEHFITLFLLKVPNEGPIQYVNAGHPPGLLFEKNGNVKPLDSQTTPIGIQELSTVEVRTFDRNLARRLHLYTDGLIEVPNRRGIFYGISGLMADASQLLDTNLDEVNRIIVEKSLEYSGRIDRDDDIALLSLDFSF